MKKTKMWILMVLTLLLASTTALADAAFSPFYEVTDNPVLFILLIALALIVVGIIINKKRKK